MNLKRAEGNGSVLAFLFEMYDVLYVFQVILIFYYEYVKC